MVSGNVQTSRLLTVESGAKITANVKAGNAVISGEIKGNVRVSDRLELTETARISGDISCVILAVEPGALIVGKVSMEGMTPEKKRTTKSRRRLTKLVDDTDDDTNMEDEFSEEDSIDA